jgi:hypothetical protein
MGDNGGRMHTKKASLQRGTPRQALVKIAKKAKTQLLGKWRML